MRRPPEASGLVGRKSFAAERKGEIIWSESEELQSLKVILKRIDRAIDRGGNMASASVDVLRCMQIVEDLELQVSRGIHRNPALVVFNPPKGRRHRRNPSDDGIIASDVQAILYRHQDDGEWYCHGFGGKDPDIISRGDSVTLTGLASKTGVIAEVEDGGKVVSLYHRDGKPIAEDI